MLVGGLAVSLWGEPRATLDVGPVLWVEPEQRQRVAERLTTEFHTLAASPVTFVLETRVLTQGRLSAEPSGSLLATGILPSRRCRTCSWPSWSLEGRGTWMTPGESCAVSGTTSTAVIWSRVCENLPRRCGVPRSSICSWVNRVFPGRRRHPDRPRPDAGSVSTRQTARTRVSPDSGEVEENSRVESDQGSGGEIGDYSDREPRLSRKAGIKRSS